MKKSQLFLYENINLSRIHMLSDTKNRSWIWSSLFVASLIFVAYLVGGAFISKEYKDRIIRWEVTGALPKRDTSLCKSRCVPPGSEPLPEGIVVRTSNLEMQPLWGSVTDYEKPTAPKNLLAIAVGIKQKEIVNQIVIKFPSSDFAVMLFHYDGIVNEWKNLEWSSRAIHISAVNQTKWWFAKRFLHPDIVSDYNYVFLWDEDVGVDIFDPIRYLSIVKSEGLEISQPALDPVKSDVHHPITARNSRSRVHRRMYKNKGSGLCDSRSTAPPCVGWVEMMVPVFSKAAWRCSWHMIQNDLIHAWGLDQLLGYCAQGDRTKKVGVVDSEFVVHLGLPTLGVTKVRNDSWINPSQGNETTAGVNIVDRRGEVRQRSFVEMEIFRERWKRSVREDPCWVDPFQRQHMNTTRRNV